MPGGKCKFNANWLDNTEWWWLEAVSDDNQKARCTVCKKNFSLGNMGKNAVISHCKSQKHIDDAKLKQSEKVGFYFKKSMPQPEPSTSKDSSSMPPVQQSQSSFINTDELLRGEIMWCMMVAGCNLSTHCSSSFKTVLTSIFPEHRLARNFSCGETKCRYLITYGLGHYLANQLKEKVKCDDFVLLFDESLNKKLQQKQMDVHVRSWNGDEVRTNFYTSLFMGHARATDIVSEIQTVLGSFHQPGLIQIGMDGPSVNWRALEIISTDHRKTFDKGLLNVGSCGLHVVHGAFKSGLHDGCDWDIGHFLSSLFYLLKDTPARRDDYVEATGSSIFPMKFVGHRWLENVPVIRRCLDILPQMRDYVSAVQKKKFPDPKTKSFSNIIQYLKDPLLEVKLQFVLCFGEILRPFLTKFQSDKPLLPFLVPELCEIFVNLISKFLTSDSLDGLGTCTQLLSFDYSDASKHKEMDLGFSAEKLLKSKELRKRVSEKDILSLRLAAKTVVIKFLFKLKEKSPMAYPLARAVTCLSPKTIKNAEPDECQKLFRKTLETLVSCKQVDESKCDRIFEQYNTFIKHENCQIIIFDEEKDRLDTFLKNLTHQKYPELWIVIKKLLLLSHGQATVEKGFSMNKEAIKDNQKASSLISRRLIKDYITANGGLQNIKVSKEMLTDCRSACHRYKIYLQEEAEKATAAEKCLKRKRGEDDIAKIKDKIQRVKMQKEALDKEFRNQFDLFASTKDFALFERGNQMRKDSEGKGQILKDLEEELDAKVKLMKQ